MYMHDCLQRVKLRRENWRMRTRTRINQRVLFVCVCVYVCAFWCVVTHTQVIVRVPFLFSTSRIRGNSLWCRNNVRQEEKARFGRIRTKDEGEVSLPLTIHVELCKCPYSLDVCLVYCTVMLIPDLAIVLSLRKITRCASFGKELPYYL